ncbi:MAG: DUF86 domain-containing protein [Clostridiales Family XIII bacterium]|jgi:uncharacterized protein with HEPN domain|nr:DUF86 domain-containing protein [Clostridiales Family XIII bacterium]
MQHRDEQIVIKLISESEELDSLLDGFELSLFLSDERTKRAVSMTLINIGELVKNTTEELRETNPQIPWRLIAGLRDVTAHHYQALIMEDIWETAKNDIPEFRRKLLVLLEN